MNITPLNTLAQLTKNGANSVTGTKESRNSAFESMFQAVVNQVKETNSYSNAAEEAETSYALGLTDSTSDLQVAQQKANLSLQYTVAIRNNIMDAYKEIMNLQF